MAKSCGVRPPAGPMVPLPLAPSPTTYLPALSLAAWAAVTFTRMMASQVAVPRRGVCAQADLPTA